MQIEYKWFDDAVACPYYESSFLREVVSGAWHYDGFSFSVTEHGKPLALIPLFVKSNERWIKKATMSPMYASGPVFCREMSLRQRVKIAKFVRDHLKDFMRRERIWFIQFTQNVFFQPGFQEGVDLGYLLADFRTTASSLVLRVASEDEMFKRMEPACRTSIRKAEKAGISVEHKILETRDVADVDTLNAAAKRTRGTPGLEGSMGYLDQMCRSGKIHLFRARHEQEGLVAYLLAHVWDRFAYYSDAGVIRSKNATGASNLLQWEAMKFFRQKGCGWFDLSLSWLMSDNEEKERVSAFKRSLGAEEIPLHRGIILHPGMYRLLRSITSTRMH